MKALKGLNENDLIFYDIKTSRGVDILEESSQMYDAWKYKARYQNELNKKTGEVFTIEDYYYEKAPLYAPFGRVVTIVVGRIKDNKITLKSYASYDEKELLESFNKDLQKVYTSNPNIRMVGFNSNGFDAPFLVKRSIINGVVPASPLDEGLVKPWELKSLDLSKVWQGSAFYPDSLVAVATALGFPSPKDALDGSKVSTAFYEERLLEIVTYCIKDVETTVRVYRKLAFLPDLEEGFELLNAPIEVQKLPLLNRIFSKKGFSEEDKAELEALLLSKEPTTEDIINLKKIILAHYQAKSDKVAVKKAKEIEVEQFVNSLYVK